MKRTRRAGLSILVLLLASPAISRAEEIEPAPLIREFRLERVDVKEANAIVRSLLNVRKSAIDVRRQVVILADTKETLDRAAEVLARVDAAVTEWSVSLVARSGGERMLLRTVNVTEGRLQVQFGSPSLPDSLGITAATRRAASGEVQIEWTASLLLGGAWTESAQAIETLRDDAVVVLLRTTDASRKKALASLLGIAGEVDSVSLEVSAVEPAAAGGERSRLGR